MENLDRLEKAVFVRLPSDLADMLERKAKQEAMGERPNMSATARRAIRYYLLTQGGKDDKLGTD